MYLLVTEKKHSFLIFFLTCRDKNNPAQTNKIMTIYQFFTPCRGGMDAHEHNVYCGCEMHGMGTEVFPRRYEVLSESTAMDLDTKEELVRHKCEIVSKQQVYVTDCAFCGGAVTSFNRTYKKADGSIHLQEDSYGTCTMCGAI
jgi:hypothetical protein